MAFHDPIDAISWSLQVQQQLLTLPWPPQLLTQPDAAVVHYPDPAFKDLVIFKGLRVRMAVNTGTPDGVQVRQMTSGLPNLYLFREQEVSLWRPC